MTNRIIITKPDDFHAHLRNGSMLKDVLGYHNVFGKVVAMGNLCPPVVNGYDAMRYQEEIKMHGARFQPIMSIMLVNRTTPEIIREACRLGVKVLKLIPGGTSTGSDEGVALADLKSFYPSLRAAEELGMIFSGHWELMTDPETGSAIAEGERETRAMPYLIDVINEFPRLKIVVEHVSTAAMVRLVRETSMNVGATITAHHLSPYCHYDVFHPDSKIRNSFLYCKPVLKTEADIKAVRKAATSGNPKFFFGSDSAPHPVEKKLGQNPAAGIFSSPVAIPYVWSIFCEQLASLDAFERFMSVSGASFYGLPINKESITLMDEPWTVPYEYAGMIPFLAGQQLDWKLEA